MKQVDNKIFVYKWLRHIVLIRSEYENNIKLRKKDLVEFCKENRIDYDYAVGAMLVLEKEQVLKVHIPGRKDARKEDVVATVFRLPPDKYWDRLDPEHGSIL